MIMPERKVPKRWTPTLALFMPDVGFDAVVIACLLRRAAA
jgi:hypothetical protein